MSALAQWSGEAFRFEVRDTLGHAALAEILFEHRILTT